MSRNHSRSSRRFPDQCSALEYILLGDLREILEQPADGNTLRWLKTVLDALLDSEPDEELLSGESEYLVEVLEQFPNWHDQVQALHAEKRQLFGKLRQLRGRLADDSRLPGIALEARSAIRDWMDRFGRHLRSERRLVQLAYTMEVGGSG